jgi:hypothetical protein
MIAGHFSIKKDIKILTCKILFVALLANFGLTLLAPTASATFKPIISGEDCWGYFVNQESNGISEMTIQINQCIDDDEDYFLGDLYDGFGRGVVNGDTFDWRLSEDFIDQYTDDNGDVIPAYIDGNEIFIPGDAEDSTAGSTYTVTFADNNVTYLINSSSEEDSLRIWGNLGSDSSTRFITLGDRLFSYQVRSLGAEDDEDSPQNFMPSYDPILLWETNGIIRSINTEPAQDVILDTLNNDDDVNVSIVGDMLELKHYAFAYQINEAFYETYNEKNLDRFFTEFLSFVNTDKTRTDVFVFNLSNSVPVPLALRQTANLSFSQSLYGSDTLSDPNGQLRKTLDSINAKYGNLIK